MAINLAEKHNKWEGMEEEFKGLHDKTNQEDRKDTMEDIEEL